MLRRAILVLFALTCLGACNLQDPSSERSNGGGDTADVDDSDVSSGDADDDEDGTDAADAESQDCLYDSDCDNPPTDYDECFEAECTGGTCEYTVPDPDLTCGTPTCSDATVTAASTCGTDGACNQSAGTTDCSPYVCNESTDGCRSSCSSDGECVDSHRCIESECREVHVVDIALSSDLMNYSLHEDLRSNHAWNGQTPLAGEITVTDGVVIGSQNRSLPAFVIETLPQHSELTVINQGVIVGKGGRGASIVNVSLDSIDVEPAEGGGLALGIVSQPDDVTLNIDNSSGVIGGGGGGGNIAVEGLSGITSVTAAAGGGGAGRVEGEGGQILDSAQETDDGSVGGLFDGGPGGQTSGAKGGRGGDLGQPGQNGNGDTGSYLPGSPGTAVEGFDDATWVEEGEIRGPTQP